MRRAGIDDADHLDRHIFVGARQHQRAEIGKAEMRGAGRDLADGRG